jgi:quinol monooxygenase YgiN
MSVVVIADFFFRRELIDDALKLLAEILPDTRRFDGCQTLETAIDLDDPGHVTLVERWTSREAHLAYFAWRQESGSAKGLAPDVCRNACPSILRASSRHLNIAKHGDAGCVGRRAEDLSTDGGLADAPGQERAGLPSPAIVGACPSAYRVL